MAGKLGLMKKSPVGQTGQPEKCNEQYVHRHRGLDSPLSRKWTKIWSESMLVIESQLLSQHAEGLAELNILLFLFSVFYSCCPIFDISRKSFLFKRLQHTYDSGTLCRTWCVMWKHHDINHMLLHRGMYSLMPEIADASYMLVTCLPPDKAAATASNSERW